MRKIFLPVMAVAVAVLVAFLSACSTGYQPATPTESATDMPSESPSQGASAAPSDSQSQVPAVPTDTATGPGDAELSITIEPGDSAATIHYTLVCEAGQAATESSHPNAQAACIALKANPGMLHRKPEPDRICTEQYGGPQKARVTGVVDGIPVDVTFSRTDGCEISAWDSAIDLLGADGGSV